jgi:hypothetical protein
MMMKQHAPPAIVTEALAKGGNLYYFGLGSNMLRSRFENRAESGKIEFLSMEPALVKNYRLAFNYRGFLPLEPAMAAIEPTTTTALLLDDQEDGSNENESSSIVKVGQPLLAYKESECHGALFLLTADTYMKVMESEGISSKHPNPSYEEIVVTVYPYAAPDQPVQALTLRARPHVHLPRDAAPSLRYMTILRQGAAELGLKPCYQEFLAQHPVQTLPSSCWLRRLALENMVFMFFASYRLKIRCIANVQSRLMFQLYIGPTPHDNPFRQFLTDIAMGAILLPGAVLGSMRLLLGIDLPPVLQSIVASTTTDALESIDDDAKMKLS